jgi:hypothetical protein
MEPGLERKLMESLEALEQGDGLEAILNRYPGEVDALRPMLETAAHLDALRLAPTVEAQLASRERLLAEAQALRSLGAAPAGGPSAWRRLLTGLATAAAMMFLVVFGLSFAARAAVPGDALYGTKRGIEEIRLGLTRDTLARQALRAAFEQERLAEIQQLLADGRVIRVEFTGPVQAMGDPVWTVAGLPVLVDEGTEIRGTPVVGSEVEVTGLTSGGQVAAESIRPTEQSRPLPAPQRPESEEATETPTTTPTPTATVTATPEPTETPQATATWPTSDEAANANDDQGNTNDDDRGNANDHDDDDDRDENDNDNDNDNSGDDDDDNDDDDDDDDD